LVISSNRQLAAAWTLVVGLVCCLLLLTGHEYQTIPFMKQNIYTINQLKVQRGNPYLTDGRDYSDTFTFSATKAFAGDHAFIEQIVQITSAV
jgi:hypothetical protein